ncbi:MAG: hypothetical protein EA353_12600 [Puniceicoccaceae bacterium]|nr:MAG: hypothetical protein EA353_12600 [Puniceicoccaceae bacterium]
MIQNIVHILMVLAIANPLCCCAADGLLSGDLDAAGPLCCSAATRDTSNSEHDPEQCPHRAAMDYPRLAHELKSGAAKLLEGDLAPVLLPLPESMHRLSGYLPESEGPVLRASTLRIAAGAPCLAELYCVYRI